MEDHGGHGCSPLPAPAAGIRALRANASWMRRKDPRLAARLVISCLTIGLIAGSSGASSAPVEAATAGQAEGLELVAEIPLDTATHMETATIKGREYAFVSETGGAGKLHVIDITDPERPKKISAVPCNGSQGNVQVSHDKKTLVIGMDVSLVGCTGVDVNGFVTIDISDLRNPRVVGFAENQGASHSVATHPTKPYVYNGEGFPKAPGRMQVWSIKDPSKPKLVTVLDTGAHSPHDLAFNRDGSMMATANAINLHLLDTTTPSDPKILYTTQPRLLTHPRSPIYARRQAASGERRVPIECVPRRRDLLL